MTTNIYIDGDGDGRTCVLGVGTTVFIGHHGATTNNESEYNALIDALNILETHERVRIYSDSQLVVYQMQGTWRCNKPELLARKNMALSIISRRGLDVDIQWIEGKKNITSTHLRRTK